MPEYCGVISDHPNVCPKRSFVEEEEAKMDPDLVADAVAKAVVLDIKDIPEDTNKLQVEVETVNTLAHNDVVLDVRAPDDAEKSPLKVEGHEVITLPFYKVSSEFGRSVLRPRCDEPDAGP